MHAHLRARPPLGRSTRGDFEGTPSFTLSARSIGCAGLRRIYREFPFDLVHAQHYGGATRAHLACRLFGWPMVYEIHSLLGDEVERDRLGRGPGFPDRRRRSRRRSASMPQAVIVLGEPVKQVVVEEKGVPAERVSVIYPGDRPGRIRPPGRRGRDRRASGPDDKVDHVRRQHRAPEPGGADPDRRSARRSSRGCRGSRCVLVGGPASAGEEYRDQARRIRRPPDRARPARPPNRSSP